MEIFSEPSPECEVSTAETEDKNKNSLPACKACYYGEDEPLPLTKNDRNESTTREDAQQESAQAQRLPKLAGGYPDEFYNLTKLAEVSLAAAAGHLFRTNYYCNQEEEHEVCVLQQLRTGEGFAVNIHVNVSEMAGAGIPGGFVKNGTFVVHERRFTERRDTRVP